MRYVCPECAHPYTPTRRDRFPRHGRVWIDGEGWGHCDGSSQEITKDTRPYVPAPWERS